MNDTERAIKTPAKAMLDDGRIITITKWRPCVPVGDGGAITAQLEGFISMPTQPEPSSSDKP